ncbi:MAG: tRNA (adenosine(37)-N6)-dimethylallyltransferase MiaA [Clostridia bacterium]|nr:tRNA (adenosine(37)-N6)-dimethylallyltransferase MiaA [Clostridia bacterium]
MKNSVLAVVGPTASGKSALALRLAEKFGGEIVSCDSMQIYRGMDIGTAKPTPEERRRVPHHMIDVLDPDEPYSAADYGDEAARVASDILSRGKLPVFCGGTGLYLTAALTGRHGEAPPSDPVLRAELTERGKTEEGRVKLYEELAAVDPASAAATHRNNLRRVVRALEIYRLTGKPKSVFDQESRNCPPRFDCLTLGLDFPERGELYRRIDLRVDEMMKEGLFTEAKTLWEKGYLAPGTTAGQAIGYRQFLPCFSGELSAEQAAEEIKLATRRYAKRQLTWFRAQAGIVWLDGGAPDLAERAENAVSAYLNK